jgi:hypothetical protein
MARRRRHQRKKPDHLRDLTREAAVSIHLGYERPHETNADCKQRFTAARHRPTRPRRCVRMSPLPGSVITSRPWAPCSYGLAADGTSLDEAFIPRPSGAHTLRSTASAGRSSSSSCSSIPRWHLLSGRDRYPGVPACIPEVLGVSFGVRSQVASDGRRSAVVCG